LIEHATVCAGPYCKYIPSLGRILHGVGVIGIRVTVSFGELGVADRKNEYAWVLVRNPGTQLIDNS
jgi:hypothetical protein